MSKHAQREKQRQTKRTLAGPKQFVLLSYATFLHDEELPCHLCMAKDVTTPGLWMQHTMGVHSLQYTRRLTADRPKLLQALHTSQERGIYYQLLAYGICATCLQELIEQHTQASATAIVNDGLGKTLVLAQRHTDFTVRTMVTPQINLNAIIEQLEGQQSVL